MQIETVAVERLIPYARNSRTHSPEQVAQIAASIREFGFTNPVLIDADGGIIAGHGRVMGARQLGMTELPCLRLGHLSETQKRAYIIADNKLALNAGWDEEILGLELSELRDADFDLGLLGFDEEELAEIFGSTEPPGDVVLDGIIDDSVVHRVRVGQIWVLGAHRLMCGDSSNREDVESLLSGAVPDLLIYDPPYEVAEAWEWYFHASAALVFADYRHVINAMRIASLYKHSYQFIWDCCTSWYNQNRPLARHKTAFFCSNDPRWNFDAAVYQDGKHRVAKAVSNTRGEIDYKPLSDGFVHLQTVYQEPNTQQDSSHAHAKPIKWLNALMRGAGGEIILDLFGGSGATIVAAPPGSRVYTMEIEPQSCDRILARWESATGGTAAVLA